MSDIFQEVDEEVRRDRAAEFWKKYQNYIYAAAALIVLATAGYRYWDYRQTEARQAAGEAFQQALKFDQEGKSAEAQAALAKLRDDAPAGYRMLARFVTAAETEKSDPKAGAAAFDALANDSSVEPLYREAARLRAALARLDAGDVDGRQKRARGARRADRRLSPDSAADARLARFAGQGLRERRQMARRGGLRFRGAGSGEARGRGPARRRRLQRPAGEVRHSGRSP